MKQLHKGKAKSISTWLLAFILGSIFSCPKASVIYANFTQFSANISDTLPLKNIEAITIKEEEKVKKSEVTNIDSMARLRADTLKKNVRDTIHFLKSKDTLDAPVTYEADDSMVFDIPAKKLYLYGKQSSVNYSSNELSAPYIQFDQNTGIVSAHLIKDSTGKAIAYPAFNQPDFKSVSDTIEFNMKTKKGLTKGTYTQQGEMFVYGEKIKKVDDNVFYAAKGRFTTCNLDTPHFAFVSNKIKFINKKMAFTGPVHPEMEGVPLPIVLPFGIYPLTQGRHSGFMAPSFTANDQLGLAMENIGYYKILSDNWDVVARGTLYSYGGWTFNVNPRYFKKYRYQGSFSFDYNKFKNGFKGDPDFSSTKTFNIRWNHSVDSKARPGVNFMANVNAGSSKFNSLVPNSPARNFTNQLNSTISFSKTWKNKPFNFAARAGHTQNTISRKIDLTLPDLTFNLNTLYPFRRKEAVGEMKWYENIGIALNSAAKSTSSFYDTMQNIPQQLIKNLAWGAQHSVPISLSLPSLGPLQIAPSVSYQEKWYQERFIRKWNPLQNKLDTVITKGFYTSRDMSFGVGMSTRIFGMYSFRKSAAVQAIRHEIRPTISLSYKPNMNAGSYYATQIDTTGNRQKYSYYERSVYGVFSDVKFGGLNFGLDNILQMKVKNGKDTAAHSLKKVSILDGFNLTSRYNFLADSFKLDPINLSARTSLFDKVNITAGASFDPYLKDANGRKIDKLIWTKNPVSLGRLTSGSISLNSNFRGGDKTKSPSVSNQTNNSGMPMDEYQQEAAYIKKNPGEFVDFSTPWTLSVNYSLRFFRTPSYTNVGQYLTNISQDFSFNGDINLTPKWKIGMSGAYNVTLHELGMLTINLSRDLHCWQMSMVVSPAGRYKFFTINISPKSSMLRDIKVNRTRYFFDL